MKKIMKFLREATMPLLILVLYLFLFRVQTVIALPSHEAFLELVFEFLENQNTFFLFLLALVEGVIITGQYAPGGTLIFLSIIALGEDFVKIAIIVSVISLALLLAYSINYFLGYQGLERIIEKIGLKRALEKAKITVNKNIFNSIFFSYFSPGLASITSTVVGISRIPYKKFIIYSAICVFTWNIFWVIFLMLFGPAFINFLMGDGAVMSLIFIWISIIFYRNFMKKEEKQTSANL